MKTVVLGLFDDLDTARRVLNQLAASPLDLDQISVVHGDLDTQRALAREAGLPAHRSPLAGTVAGALVGAGLGYYAGTAVAPEALGWLLAVALGAALGAVAGAALGALSETVRVPKVHQSEVLAALAEGATALIVRSDSLPTARAVGDLFRVAGSRELSPLGPAPGAAAADAASDFMAAADGAAAGAEAVLDEGIVAEPLGEAFAPAPADDHTQFAPPTSPDVAPTAQAPAPAAAASPSAGETLYAPPWRRGVVDPADATPAPDPTPRPAPAPVATPPAAATAPAAATPAVNSPPAVDAGDGTAAASAAPRRGARAATDAPVAAPAAGVPSDAAADVPAAPVAGRTATHQIARLLLDAIDELESGAPPPKPARAPSRPRAPRKGATPSS